MKMNRHLITVLATGAGLVASVVLAFRAGMKADEILREEDPDGELNLLQKAKKVAPTVLPAAGAVALTGAGIVADFCGREKEFKAAENKIKNLSSKKEKLKQDFEKYRDTLAKTEGEKTELDVAMRTAAPLCLEEVDEGETKHVFKIDWLCAGDDCRNIYLETSYMKIFDGLNEVNRILLDKEYGNTDCATVSNFLTAAGFEGLCNSDTEAAGWCAPILRKECDVYWIGFTFNRTVNQDGTNEIIEIVPDIYPNFDVRQYIDECKAMGII